MKLRSSVLFIGVVAGTMSCGVLTKDNNSKKPGMYNAIDKGCVEGVITNGITQERVGLTGGARGDRGVYVFANNVMIKGHYRVSNPNHPNTNKALVGEYYLCGVPVNETLPLVVWQDGYQDFEAEIRIPGNEPKDLAEGEQPKASPTLLANINLFPKGVEAQDLSVNVLYKGQTLEGAQVVLKPTLANVAAGQSDEGEHVGEGGEVFRFSQSRVQTLVGKTDESGNATFNGEDLVLGGEYVYTIIPPAGSNAPTVMSTKEENIIVGLRGNVTKLTDEPFEVLVKLEAGTSTPVLEGSSIDNGGVNAEGSVTLWFDRDIELTPSSLKDLTVSALGLGKAELKLDKDGKPIVHADAIGRRLTLSPEWVTKPTAKDDPAAVVTYTFIKVKVERENDSGFWNEDVSVNLFYQEK
ncbi:MAG: hypothetical protein AB7T49_16350 [Oligoflexales bacterium]